MEALWPLYAPRLHSPVITPVSCSRGKGRDEGYVGLGREHGRRIEGVREAVKGVVAETKPPAGRRTCSDTCMDTA